MHHYDPENYNDLEGAFSAALQGYWVTQDALKEYGMWSYRSWHDTDYNGDGTQNLYRLYNGTHHYEAIMPWLAYARSGDPFYLTQGWANMRMLSDVQMIHFQDLSYPQHVYSWQRLVGSTRHKTTINWAVGGDHAVLGHITCYNGVINAYYLTGDLRLREILVEEWQDTLLTKRGDREVIKANADQSGPWEGRPEVGRNRNNAIGELIDFLPIDLPPGHLARLAPVLRRYTLDMWHSGQPLHNVLQFRGSQELREILLKGSAEYRARGIRFRGVEDAGNAPDTPAKLWNSSSPHENFALAAITSPKDGYWAEPYEASNPVRRQTWAASYLKTDRHQPTRNAIPDYIIYLPRVMYAMAQAGAKGGDFSWRELEKMEPAPTSGGSVGQHVDSQLCS